MTTSESSQASPHFNTEEIEHYWTPIATKLLRLGGVAATRPMSDYHIKDIFERGRLQKGRRVKKQGLPNECHANACELWMRSNGKKSLCTGYALCSQGTWWQHSWCMSLPGVTTPRIFETTCEWKMYFGIALEELEAFQFVYATFGGEADSLFDRNPQMRGLFKNAVERGKAAGTFRLD